MERAACAHRECATRHAPLDRHGRGHLPHGVASWTARKRSRASRDRRRHLRDRSRLLEPQPAPPRVLARGDERHAALELKSNPLSIGRHLSGIPDPFNGHIDEFRIAYVQRSDGWIETTCNNMSDPGAFAAAGAEEQQGGEPPPPLGAVVV
jgi:hypothetical protein